MKVCVEYTVSANALPATIAIRTFGGSLIYYGKVRCGFNRLCFCSRERKIIITVRPYDADFSEKSYFIKFGRCPRYDIRLNFGFVSETETVQTFCLYDENYRFPIPDAKLFFSAVS